MKVLWLDPSSGMSGDMTLATLVDLGFAFDELAALPAALGLQGVRLTEERVQRGPFAARKIDVHVTGDQPHRHLAHVLELLGKGPLPPRALTRATNAFTRLAKAEAEVHGTTVEKVHFHEVGAADAIVDIAGACLGLERLGVEVVYATAPAVGSGTVRAAHGTLPVPAPATARILADANAPIDLAPLEGERLTPTGASLLAAWVTAWEAPPPFKLLAQGFGAGGRDPKDRPNVLRALLGETEAAIDRRIVRVLETALDDASPQVVARVLARALELGARDAYATPMVMKKGRPGVLVTLLCDPGNADELARLLFRETTTIGLRVRDEARVELPRERAEVVLPEGTVELKVVTLPDGSRRARPEYESLATLAKDGDLDALARRAIAAWERAQAP